MFERRILEGGAYGSPDAFTFEHAFLTKDEGDPRFWDLLLRKYTRRCERYLRIVQDAELAAARQLRREERRRHLHGDVSPKLAITGDARAFIEQL